MTNNKPNAESKANVQVLCRFRPINEKQQVNASSLSHQILDNHTLIVKEKQNKDKQPLKFTFDHIFHMNSTQEEVYKYAAAPIIESVIEGFNGTIFAYGQTASGKTHTIQGFISEKITENSGIIPRMVRQMFDSIAEFNENMQFRIKVSFVQLYMQKFKDLLDVNKNDLKIRQDKKKGIFIEDLTQKYISSEQQIYKLIQIAKGARSVASTNMNERSSRSHMIFIVTINQSNILDLSSKTGKLYLVDLAGSEKINKTGAEVKSVEEAKKINLSLTSLGKVINALSDGKSTFIPYRDSKLTRVLQQSLGGNSKTALIITCSPYQGNLSETISTLRFGVSAKKIKNSPKINKELSAAQLQALLQKSQRQIQSKKEYISLLKNYISFDLKKSIPEFEASKPHSNKGDYLIELQKQLDIEKNIHSIQNQQINSLKRRFEQLYAEKQQLEKQLQKTQLELDNNTKEMKSLRETQSTNCSTKREKETTSSSKDEIFKQIEKFTTDENILNLIKELFYLQNIQIERISQELQNQTERRKKAEDNLLKYQKSMQKKFIQLQNNMCQLTHAYYDLIVVQQKYKLQNMFFEKELQNKDLIMGVMEKKIQDLENENRYLQEDVNDGDEKEGSKEVAETIGKRYDNKLQQMRNNAKVVKIVRGGLK